MLLSSTLPLGFLATTANALSVASVKRCTPARADVRMSDDSSTCYFAVVHEFNDNAEVRDQNLRSVRAPPQA